MNLLLLIAGVLCGIVCLIHAIAGIKTVAKPLLKATDLEDVAKYTRYYCWHIVTIVLAAMTLAFVRSAHHPASQDLAWLATALAVAFSVWGIILPPAAKQNLQADASGLALRSYRCAGHHRRCHLRLS